MNYHKISQFELLFWLQIMGDHARFIRDTLASSEVEYIFQAEQFIVHYDDLLEQARQIDRPSIGSWLELAQTAYVLTEQFRIFKLNILSNHLVCNVKISLSPTFINHMLNELEEFLRILNYLVREDCPPKVHPVHHHLLWLLDAAGHASAIEADLDSIEKKWKIQAEEFSTTFEGFFIKAKEMAGFLRARQDLFPALQQFNKEASLEIVLFYNFIQELKEMRFDCSVLGILEPLMADHMGREECYYLTKLAEIDPEHVKMLDCNPIAPRFVQ